MEWLNDNSGAIQGISTLVLVVVTIYYAWSTRQIATETRDMATATEEAVKLTRKQQVEAARPVIAIRLARPEAPYDNRPTIQKFELEIVNVGVGPALDFEPHIDSPLRIYYANGPALPMTVAVGELVSLNFELYREAPFHDPSALSWPRDATDAEAERKTRMKRQGGQREAVPAGSAEAKRHREEDQELHQLKWTYMEEVARIIHPLSSGGSFRATYRDVLGRSLESEVELQFRESTSVDPRHEAPELDWKTLFLGALQFRVENQS